MDGRIFIVVFLLINAGCTYTYGELQFYISPSQDIACSKDPCLTLSQFAANSSHYVGNATNISLVFLPGNHTLEGELTLSQVDNISLTTESRNSERVSISCVDISARFVINETFFAAIKGLNFIGCGGNKVSEVKKFIAEDNTFNGSSGYNEGRGTALALNAVTSAEITRNKFVSNAFGENSERRHKLEFLQDESAVYHFNLPSDFIAIGGALYAAFSTVLVSRTAFMSNTAEVGGAAFAVHSSVNFSHCTISYNRGIQGGAITVTAQSTVHIDGSTFSRNSARYSGGVILAYYNSMATVSNSIITHNRAGYGGFLYVHRHSSSEIKSCTFHNNTASTFGGVMQTQSGSYTIYISDSTFTNNSAY